MSWAFSVTGSSKEQCISAIEESAPPSDPDNAKQHTLMLAVLKQELDSYGVGSTGMSISAYGHAPPVDDGGARSFSISISGAAAAAMPAKAPAVVETPAAAAKPAPKAR
jgi:hypothetical protein